MVSFSSLLALLLLALLALLLLTLFSYTIYACRHDLSKVINNNESTTSRLTN
jgi:hypothetical protein